jgi:hypothetical protein
MKMKMAAGLLIIVSTVASATSPQVPIAEGPFESVIEATTAARKCGYEALRLRVRREQSQLFIDGDMREEREEAARKCLWAWMTPRAQRMKFSPRWWKDDFTLDHP